MLKVVKASFLCGYVKTSWLHRADVSIKTIPLLFFLIAELFQLQPRISFPISKGWTPSPPANPNPSRPLGTQDALHVAESASSWVRGDPKEQTQVIQLLPRSGACLEPSFHKQSHILSVRLRFSAPRFFKSSLLTISIKVSHSEMLSQALFVPKFGLNPKTPKSLV